MGNFSRLAALGLVFISTSVSAQTLPSGDQPGRIEQRFVPPPTAKASVAIRQGLESSVPPDKADKIFMNLRAVRFEGNTVFSDAQLKALAKQFIGKRVSLRDVFKIATDVTTQYGKAGYTLSRAIVPPQEFDQAHATVTIRVIEGYIDHVTWPKEVGRYRDLFSSYSEKITAERPIRVTTMERYLLLANDLPGLKFSSKLKASNSNPAASTLEVTLDSEKHVSASLGVDNRGTQASGPYQANALVTFSNVLGLDEEIKLGYTLAGPQANSASPELSYLNFGYHQVLSSEGLAFDFSGNTSWGQPGTTDLLLLNYQTDSLNLTGSLSYPFIRTRDTNLSGLMAFDFKNAESDMLGTLASNDRLRIVRGELSFDHADEGNGINQAILSLSQGIIGLGSTENGNVFASRASGRVDFTKASLQLSRTQDLRNGNSAYVLGFGQVTATPLLSSQQCGYGGSWMGRGFEPSVLSGDDCAIVLGELRHDVDTRVLGLSKLQFYGFADYGSIWNIDPALGTPAQDDAASAGAGLRFGWTHFDADLQAAYQLKQPNSSTTANRFGLFFDVTARF